MKKNIKMNKTLKFLKVTELGMSSSMREYRFVFSLIDTKLINSPEEKKVTEHKILQTSISDILDRMWSFQDGNYDRVKILFEYGRRYLINKVIDSILQLIAVFKYIFTKF